MLQRQSVKPVLSPGNRGGRWRSDPGEAGRCIKCAFLAPGAGRVPESMQKPPFSTPPLAPRAPRVASHDELHPLITSYARLGLAQDFIFFLKRSVKKFPGTLLAPQKFSGKVSLQFFQNLLKADIYILRFSDFRVSTHETKNTDNTKVQERNIRFN